MEKTEFARSKVFEIAEVLEYAPNSIVIKSIIKRITGNISAISFDAGEELSGNILPYETFILILDGIAELVINDKSHFVEKGQSIIIPAHSKNTIKANEKFKMLSALIKSGYEG